MLKKTFEFIAIYLARARARFHGSPFFAMNMFGIVARARARLLAGQAKRNDSHRDDRARQRKEGTYLSDGGLAWVHPDPAGPQPEDMRSQQQVLYRRRAILQQEAKLAVQGRILVSTHDDGQACRGEHGASR